MSKKVALLIGVSEYGEGILSLTASTNDVNAMKRVLENPDMGGFDEIKTLINPDPIAMRIAAQQIFTNLREDDLVLLFFSGHGITDDDHRLYLATKGTSKDFYQATSVPASFIQDISLESYAKRQVIILDCCYSGAFAEGWQIKSVGVDLKKELGSEGRVVLTSSSDTQTSFQQENATLSLYTKYLVEGIETGAADEDEDGKIYARELHNYAKRKVQEEKPKQKPAIILDRRGYDVLISRASVSDLEVELKSETGVDYTPLRDLLAAGQWEKADKETWQVMTQAFVWTKETPPAHFDFYCEDLRTINQLWLHYSNGKFGFSVQKEIYQSLGGTTEYDKEVWKKFCERVGWKKETLGVMGWLTGGYYSYFNLPIWKHFRRYEMGMYDEGVLSEDTYGAKKISDRMDDEEFSTFLREAGMYKRERYEVKRLIGRMGDLEIFTLLDAPRGGIPYGMGGGGKGREWGDTTTIIFPALLPALTRCNL